MRHPPARLYAAAAAFAFASYAVAQSDPVMDICLVYSACPTVIDYLAPCGGGASNSSLQMDLVYTPTANLGGCQCNNAFYGVLSSCLACIASQGKSSPEIGSYQTWVDRCDDYGFNFTANPVRTGNNTTTNPLPTPDDPSSGSSGLGSGAIAGIAVGAVAVIALVAGLLFFLRHKKRAPGVAAANSHVGGDKEEYNEEDNYTNYSVGANHNYHNAPPPPGRAIASTLPVPTTTLPATSTMSIGSASPEYGGYQDAYQLPQQDYQPQPYHSNGYDLSDPHPFDPYLAGLTSAPVGQAPWPRHSVASGPVSDGYSHASYYGGSTGTDEVLLQNMGSGSALHSGYIPPPALPAASTAPGVTTSPALSGSTTSTNTGAAVATTTTAAAAVPRPSDSFPHSLRKKAGWGHHSNGSTGNNSTSELAVITDPTVLNNDKAEFDEGEDTMMGLEPPPTRVQRERGTSSPKSDRESYFAGRRTSMTPTATPPPAPRASMVSYRDEFLAQNQANHHHLLNNNNNGSQTQLPPTLRPSFEREHRRSGSDRGSVTGLNIARGLDPDRSLPSTPPPLSYSHDGSDDARLEDSPDVARRRARAAELFSAEGLRR